MSLIRTNDRELLLRNQTRGVDDLVDHLLENPEDEAYSTARGIRSSPVKKNYVEACLLTGRSYADISDVLEISTEALETYAKIYYDIEALDKLSILALIEKEPEDSQVMKHWALSQGLEFIAWRLGKYGEVDATKGLTSLFNDCFYKSKEAFFSPNASSASKESLKWIKMSMDIARLLRSWESNTADDVKADIIFALKQVNPDFKSIDDLDLEELPEIALPVEPEKKDSGD